MPPKSAIDIAGAAAFTANNICSGEITKVQALDEMGGAQMTARRAARIIFAEVLA